MSRTPSAVASRAPEKAVAAVTPSGGSAVGGPSPSPQVLTVTARPSAGVAGEAPLPAPSASGLAGIAPAVPSGGRTPVVLVSATVVVPASPPAAQVAAAPVGAPQILGATLSPNVVSTGTKVAATVRTTPEVVSVVAKIAGQTIPVPKVGVGRFAGSTTVPLIPPFFHGTYPVTFVAVNARGVSTQAAVNVIVH
ncbi:MAG TPA: hypothetical protein VMA36_21765 [Candidatus Limnocylindria bacterium]|nr:hypothetical protein [Candidatus Limnocylindria bacterium]